jgi:hypothetical protein
LTPESIQPKYAQMVASTGITPGCVQFLKNKKRFHTAWTQRRRAHLPLARCFSRDRLMISALAKFSDRHF